MKMKLDENIGRRGQYLLMEAGHDVCTILEQNLPSAPDPTVIEVCRMEQRCLVTLDLDFSNPLQYNPTKYSGIAVIRLPKRPSPHDLLDAIVTLINALKTEIIIGKLWIIKRGQIRIHQQESLDLDIPTDDFPLT
jgi:predicted nuclease of predicted toxin-antitoxin system